MSAYDFEDYEEIEDDELEDEVAAEGNRVTGAKPKAVLEYVVHSIVDHPEEVVIDVIEERKGLVFELSVDPEDMGRVIGRRGRVANALRTLVRAASADEKVSTSVEIVD